MEIERKKLLQGQFMTQRRAIHLLVYNSYNYGNFIHCDIGFNLYFLKLCANLTYHGFVSKLY